MSRAKEQGGKDAATQYGREGSDRVEVRAGLAKVPTRRGDFTDMVAMFHGEGIGRMPMRTSLVVMYSFNSFAATRQLNPTQRKALATGN
jgi:hypothetical protein